MIKIHVEKKFDARPELLWELVVDSLYYSIWVEAFSEGAAFSGDWTSGNKIRFVVEDEDGLENGMLSEIVESRWPEFISIRHLGIVVGGIADYDSSMAQEWAPAFENYSFVSQGEDGCLFKVDQDLPEEEAETFKDNWQEAFARMAALLETNPDIGRVINLREKSSHSPQVIWDKLTQAEKVKSWNFASDDWHCPQAQNNLELGGEFHYEMAAKDGSASFDYWGTYTEIDRDKSLAFVLGDGRKVRITIEDKPYGSLITESFEVEAENSLDLQRHGWSAILKNLAS